MNSDERSHVHENPSRFIFHRDRNKTEPSRTRNKQENSRIVHATRTTLVPLKQHFFCNLERVSPVRTETRDIRTNAAWLRFKYFAHDSIVKKKRRNKRTQMSQPTEHVNTWNIECFAKGTRATCLIKLIYHIPETNVVQFARECVFVRKKREKLRRHNQSGIEPESSTPMST